MQLSYESMKQSQKLIKNLLSSIQESTSTMSKTFQQAIFRHEQQFMKTYRIKIPQLVSLFVELKSTIQDKFINNTLASQLETVLKERDYFKYESLKLNSQYKNLLEDHKNLLAQISNTTQQANIYKHLLQMQKIKNTQIGSNTQKLKKDLHQIANKNIAQVNHSHNYLSLENQRQLQKNKKQNRQKNEIIRAFKQRIIQLQKNMNSEKDNRLQKKELYQLFKVCVQSWKRQLITKNKKSQTKLSNIQQLSGLNKKQLLRVFFTHSQFLKFLDRLLFDDGFKVTFECTEEQYMQRNRQKLIQYMNKKRINTSSRVKRM